MSNKMVNDTACMIAWDEAMKTFNALVENNGTKKEADVWKEKYIHMGIFSFRQRDAIAARHKFFTNGTYGQTKIGIEMKVA